MLRSLAHKAIGRSLCEARLRRHSRPSFPKQMYNFRMPASSAAATAKPEITYL